MSKGYSGKTPYYGIPFPKLGDFASPEDESKSANIIENQLLAATRGVKCCIFEDGEYHLVDNVDGTYTVMLTKYGVRDSIEGILNGGYVWTDQPILWEGLKRGEKRYLYVKYTSKLYQDETAFAIEISTILYPKESPYHLLMAIFDWKNGDKPTLDTNPDQKTYGTDITLHTTDFRNPHGERLEQNELVIFNQIKYVKNNQEKVIIPLNVLICEEKSGGKDGKILGFEDVTKIINVDVKEKVIDTPTFKLGEIAIKHNTEKSFTIYNSGDKNIPMIITILYEV